MIASLLLRDDTRSRARLLLIGLGAGLAHQIPVSQLSASEADRGGDRAAGSAAARQFFKLPDDPLRLNIVIADGAQFIAENDKTYDLILVDGFDEDARPARWTPLPFYQMCRAGLTTTASWR